MIWGFSNIHAYANLFFIYELGDSWIGVSFSQFFLPFNYNLRVSFWACMFHFPWQAEGFQIYTLTRTCFFYSLTWRFLDRGIVFFISLWFNQKLRVSFWACMFHFPWQAEGFQTYTFKHTRLQTYIFLIFLWWLSVYVWACMFHFPWQAAGFQTYTLKHTRLTTNNIFFNED